VAPRVARCRGSGVLAAGRVVTTVASSRVLTVASRRTSVVRRSYAVVRRRPVGRGRDVLSATLHAARPSWRHHLAAAAAASQQQHSQQLSSTHSDVCSDRRTTQDKAVIDRRLRPRRCHPGSYFKRPKVVPCVRWPATGITAHSL